MNYAVSEANTLPASEHAERTILGAMLLDSTRLVDVASALQPDDFSLDSHRIIFQAMLSLFEQGRGIDLVTVAQRLGDRKEIETVGGVSYVASLNEGLPRRPEITDYLRIVKDKAICRELITLSDALEGRAYSQDESGLEIASWAITRLSQIAEQGETKVDVFTAAELAEEAEYRTCDNPEQVPSISTGLRTLDEFTGGGIRLGELWVIGAAPSRGKTTLARQIVAGAIRGGAGAYVHSGEMTKESWFEITACLLENMPAWKVREPRLLNLTEREMLRHGLRSLAQMPLFISDRATISLDRLIWNATRAKRRHNIQLFAVDYAQIVNAPGKDIREQVMRVAYRLRDFAKAEGVATILLSQSPRPEGRKINTRPNMHSLKESGSLEEAAHVIILPYRLMDEETSKFTGEDELIIGKNRNGVLDSVKVKLDGQLLRFEER